MVRGTGELGAREAGVPDGDEGVDLPVPGRVGVDELADRGPGEGSDPRDGAVALQRLRDLPAVRCDRELDEPADLVGLDVLAGVGKGLRLSSGEAFAAFFVGLLPAGAESVFVVDRFSCELLWRLQRRGGHGASFGFGNGGR